MTKNKNITPVSLLSEDQGGSATSELATLLASWHRYLTSEKRVSPHTLSNYSRDVGYFVAFLHSHLGGTVRIADLASLGIRDFRSFLAARRRDGVSNATVARTLSSVRNLFRYLDRAEGIRNDAIAAIEAPKLPHKVPRPLSEKDAQKVLEIAGKPDAHSGDAAKTADSITDWTGLRDAAILTLLYGCGLRISEALGMNVGDIPEGDTMRIIGKRRKERLVPILPIVRQAVDAYVKACPYVLEHGQPLFIGVRGNRMNARTVQLLMERIRGKLGLPDSATPHALRHSFATHLLGRGGDLRTIQELLGHADLASTQVYTEVDAARIQDIYSKAFRRA
ncbi:tyrosine recombinase XerC [Kordiimonas sediminis]|uniref:Tyrosine recombinase XerC n=1 Tax=Kordiimonas sediminis TaxID=1735581 RepID=A0A919ARE7_9PROT|nr:tyrosine recombinase XerC [Kordiimonas sediminis]GHF19706.1 tyrosine recombinase XerC [Kordiimonas sediminis]